MVELKIRYAVKDSDPQDLLKEVDSILRSVSALSEKDREQLNLDFDKAVYLNDDYTPIIRELNKYYDVDYIIYESSRIFEQHV